MKKKAILFLPYLAPYRVDVLNELNEYFNLTVIFQFDNAPEQSFDQVKLRNKLRVKFEIFESGFNIGTRQIRIGVYRLLKRHRPDVVFSNEYGPTSLMISFYKTLGLFKFTHIATTSDNVYIAENAIKLRKIARSIVLKTTKGIIVYNKDIKVWYQKHFPRLIVNICPNIQNPKSLTSTIDIQRQIAKSYQYEYELINKNVILYVGRLDSVKGIDLLLRAFSKIEPENKKLILIGDGPQKEFLMSLTKQLNLSKSVVFAGRFEGEKLLAWYQLANFLVLPSTHEPFGAVVNEALICGLPVLCSEYAGAKFFIKKPQSGIIFNPKLEKEFIDTLKTGLSKFSSSIKKENLMNYNFNESVSQYYLTFKEIN